MATNYKRKKLSDTYVCENARQDSDSLKDLDRQIYLHIGFRSTFNHHQGPTRYALRNRLKELGLFDCLNLKECKYIVVNPDNMMLYKVIEKNKLDSNKAATILGVPNAEIILSTEFEEFLRDYINSKKNIETIESL